MRSGWVLFKKELKAIAKTYRIWLVPLLFSFFGILSPVTAKFMPAIFKAAVSSDPSQQQVFGQIKIPDPTYADAYLQWLQNITQFGILALILLSMGLVADERSRGTLALIVTKPVSRAAIVVSKFAAQFTLLASSIALGAAVCYLYAYLLFESTSARALALSTIAYGGFALVVLSAALLFSVIFKRSIAAGGLTLLTVFTLTIASYFGKTAEKYVPGGLTSVAVKIARGSTAFSQAYPALGVAVALSIVLIAVAVLIINRQEI